MNQFCSLFLQFKSSAPAPLRARHHSTWWRYMVNNTFLKKNHHHTRTYILMEENRLKIIITNQRHSMRKINQDEWYLRHSIFDESHWIKPHRESNSSANMGGWGRASPADSWWKSLLFQAKGTECTNGQNQAPVWQVWDTARKPVQLKSDGRRRSWSQRGNGWGGGS